MVTPWAMYGSNGPSRAEHQDTPLFGAAQNNNTFDFHLSRPAAFATLNFRMKLGCFSGEA